MLNDKTLMESARIIDRVVFDVSRARNLRGMQAYVLMALNNLDNGQGAATAEIAEKVAASSSQTKQVALVLQERGFVKRIGWTGVTVITPKGRTEAQWLETNIIDQIKQRN